MCSIMRIRIPACILEKMSSRGLFVLFSSERSCRQDYFCEDEMICYADESKKLASCMNIHEMNLVGIHNVRKRDGSNCHGSMHMAFRYGSDP